MNSLYEEIFYQELVSPEERLSDVDTGEEIIINNVVSDCVLVS